MVKVTLFIILGLLLSSCATNPSPDTGPLPGYMAGLAQAKAYYCKIPFKDRMAAHQAKVAELEAAALKNVGPEAVPYVKVMVVALAPFIACPGDPAPKL